jgi:hypothetical protein
MFSSIAVAPAAHNGSYACASKGKQPTAQQAIRFSCKIAHVHMYAHGAEVRYLHSLQDVTLYMY